MSPCFNPSRPRSFGQLHLLGGQSPHQLSRDSAVHPGSCELRHEVYGAAGIQPDPEKVLSESWLGPGLPAVHRAPEELSGCWLGPGLMTGARRSPDCSLLLHPWAWGCLDSQDAAPVTSWPQTITLISSHAAPVSPREEEGHQRNGAPGAGGRGCRGGLTRGEVDSGPEPEP